MIFNLLLILVAFIIYIIIMNFKIINPDKRELFFLRIMFFAFFILVATREMTIGNDTQMYLKLFEKCSSLKWSAVKFDGYFEWGYLVFNVLVSYLSSSKRFFMFVMSGIFNFVCYYFIKKNSNNYFLSTIMYICLLFFYTSMTMMRQYLALMIVLSGFKFIKEKKPLLFVVSVAFASLFHSSIWLTLLFYPIYHFKYSKTRAIAIFFICIIATLSVGPLINSIYQILGRTNFYVDQIGNNSLANFLFTTVYFIMYLFALYEIKIKKKQQLMERDNFYLYTILFAACVNMIAIKMNVLSRAAEYFSFITIIVLPNITENHIYEIKNKKLAYIIICIILIAYSSTIIYYRPEWNSAYNYRSCIIENNNDLCN